MAKIVFDSDVPPNALSSLMEGYLSGLGEVCHTLFGAKGEAVMYEAVGDAFKKHLKRKRGIDFTDSDPWKRYCEIVGFFTAQGFYSHVELEEAGEGRYWMLESGQYAGDVWEEQKSWERGTPPCPLWAIIVCSMSEIGIRVVLDRVDYRADICGYESTFHFEKIRPGSEGILDRARREIRESIFASNMLDVVAENTTDAIFLKDLEGRYLFANKAVSRFVGMPLAEIPGKDDTALFSPDSSAFVKERDREVIRSGRVLTFEETVTADGETRTFLATKGVFRDSEGKPVGLFGISRDITERKRVENALRSSEERNRTILMTAMEGFWLVDMRGRLLDVNETYCRMSGYRRREILTMRITDLDAVELPEDTAVRIQAIKVRGEDRFESRHRRKDGSIFNVEISVQYRPFDGGRFVVFLRDITGRKLAEEQILRSREELRMLACHLQESIEEERRRIAREIHDELGQQLATLKNDLAWTRTHLHGGSPLLAGKIRSMLQLVEATTRSVRSIIHELRPLMLDDLGLPEAIDWQVSEFRGRTGIACQMDAVLDDFDLAPDAATGVFRLLQEMLTNVARHSGAKRCQVRIRRRRNGVFLSVRDDGTGIPAGRIVDPGSFGLLGMRERVRGLGGRFRIRGTAGKGTIVAVMIPVRAAGCSPESEGGTQDGG